MSYTVPSITASGTTFAQFQAGGLSGHLENLIARQPASSAPVTALTWTATGGGTTGGLLAAGTYLAVFTELNGIGETTGSPESAVISVAATNIPQVIFPALRTNNVARNIYLTPAGGATTTEVLYATGVTAVTTTLAVAAPSNSYAVKPPTVNTTGLTYVDSNGSTLKKPLELLRGAKDGNLEDAYRYARMVIEEFNSGKPTPFGGTIMKFRHAHTVFAMLSTLFAEAGTLLDANAGTLGTSINAIGNPKPVRTWP